MPGKDPDLEKLIPDDLLRHPASNSPQPPGHDAILDLLAAQPPGVLSTQRADVPDVPNHLADIFTSAEPPALFRPGDTGIMSPNPTFPGIAPPAIPGPLQNRSQAHRNGTGLIIKGPKQRKGPKGCRLAGRNLGRCRPGQCAG